LAFLGHPLKSLGRVLDSILAVVAIGRKQANHFIGASGGRTGNIARGEINGLSNGEFVFQRPSPYAWNAGDAHGPAAGRQLKTLTKTYHGAGLLGQCHPDMANTRICRFFSTILRFCRFPGNPRAAAETAGPSGQAEAGR
jgi:hypothetical protein